MRRWIAILLIGALVLGIWIPACMGNAISAQSAVVYDPLSKEFVFEKNGDEKRLIASTTKIMTALVVLESCDLEEMVEVPKDCERVGGSSMYLRAGEEVTVRDLLYGLLLMSGNNGLILLSALAASAICLAVSLSAAFSTSLTAASA